MTLDIKYEIALLACLGAHSAWLQTEKSKQQFSISFEPQNPKNLGSKTSVATSSPITAVPAEIRLTPLPELKPAPTCQLSSHLSAS